MGDGENFRVIGWFVLGGTSKPILFHALAGTLALFQVAQSSPALGFTTNYIPKQSHVLLALCSFLE